MGVVRDHLQGLLQWQSARPADQAGQCHAMRHQQNLTTGMLPRDLVDRRAGSLRQLKQVLTARRRDMNGVKLPPLPDGGVLGFDLLRLHPLPFTQAHFAQTLIHLGPEAEFFTDDLSGKQRPLQIAAIDGLDTGLHQQVQPTAAPAPGRSNSAADQPDPENDLPGSNPSRHAVPSITGSSWGHLNGLG